MSGFSCWILSKIELFNRLTDDPVSRMTLTGMFTISVIVLVLTESIWQSEHFRNMHCISNSCKLINRYSKHLVHFCCRRPTLAQLLSGSNGANGGRPLRGTFTLKLRLVEAVFPALAGFLCYRSLMLL